MVYLQGKQYRFTTGVKVLPSQWDGKLQVAINSNVYIVNLKKIFYGREIKEAHCCTSLFPLYHGDYPNIWNKNRHFIPQIQATSHFSEKSSKSTLKVRISRLEWHSYIWVYIRILRVKMSSMKKYQMIAQMVLCRAL